MITWGRNEGAALISILAHSNELPECLPLQASFTSTGQAKWNGIETLESVSNRPCVRNDLRKTGFPISVQSDPAYSGLYGYNGF